MNSLTKVLITACLTVALAPAERYFEPDPDPSPAPGPETRAVTLARSGGSYLGIGVVELTEARVRELNLREEHGVEITRVEDDSPASKGGLQKGDVVREYNGQRVEGVEQFMRLVRETPPGREVKLSVHRNGGPQQLAVRTGMRKSLVAAKVGEGAFEFPDIRIPDVPRAVVSWRSTFLGIEGESLDSQLAQFFGVKEGVLVRSVVKGSAAEKAGLKAGDVIVRVDDAKVATPREISSAVRAAQARKSATVAIIRDKQEMTLSIPVDTSESRLNW